MQTLNGVPVIRKSASPKHLLRLASGLLFLLSTMVTAAYSQSFPGAGILQSNGVPDEALRALMQRMPTGQNSGSQLEPSIQIQNPPVYSPYSPYAPGYSTRSNRQDNYSTMADAAPSSLEKLMTVRIGQPVQQFGYDLFGHGAPVIVRQSGALQDNYMLGTGDEIVVTFQGQQNAAYRVRVDRDGRLVLPGIAPVSASGRSFGALRGDLEAAVARSFVGTRVAASIGEVRQLSVRVVGEVNTPGIFSLTGLSTALDALNLAGGVKKTGSLRNIKIMRGNHTIPLDIYALITGRSGKADITLAEGDRILVPLHTLSAAVVGQVKRPAIYEFPPGQTTVRISDLLELAGGPQLRGSYRFSILRTRDDGKRELVQVDSGSQALIRDGDALLVDSAADVSLAKVELMGSVTLAGSYALDSASSLHSLLKSSDIFSLKAGQPLPYLLIAGVLRIDSQSFQRTVLPFSPVDVLAGKSDIRLQSNDVVYIINGAEMRYIAAVASAAQEAAKRQQPDDGTQQNRAPEQPGTLQTPRQQDTIQATIGALQTAPALGSATEIRGTAGATGQQIGYPRISQPDAFPNEAYNNGINRTYPGDFSDQDTLQERAPVNNNPLPQLDGIPDPFDTGPYDTSFAPWSDGQNDSGTSYDGRPQTRTLPAPSPMLRRNTRRRRLFAGLDDEQRQLLVSTLGNYYVIVAGEVNHPGAFLAMPETTLDRMVEAAGGLTPKVDLKGFEITSAEIDNRSGTSRTIRKSYDIAADEFSTIALRPYDRVRFNPVFSDRDEGEVTMYGELRFPGSYEILRGEHLSSVLARAGGFTDAAYPYGAIFLRRSVAEQQRGVMQREADTLQSQLVSLLGSTSSKVEISPSEIQYVDQMAERLRLAEGQGGRVAIQLDPKKLAGHPELDIVLEPGDRLFVPRKPNSVVVAGEVMSPSGLQYRDHMTVRSYIEQAGGVTEIADESHIFVVQPDGSAVQASDGGWLGESTPLAPGSVIVVPRNLRPFSFDTLFENIVQTTSQLAITAASLSVVVK